MDFITGWWELNEKMQTELSTGDWPKESPQRTFAVVIKITRVIHNYGPSV